MINVVHRNKTIQLKGMDVCTDFVSRVIISSSAKPCPIKIDRLWCKTHEGFTTGYLRNVNLFWNYAKFFSKKLWTREGLAI